MSLNWKNYRIRLGLVLLTATTFSITACGADTPQDMDASEASQIQYGLDEAGLTAAESVDNFLSSRSLDITLNADNVLNDREAAFEVEATAGTLHVELGGDRDAAVADLLETGEATIRLQPDTIEDFYGAFGEDTDLDSIDRNDAPMHVVGHYHRTICGVRRLMARGYVEYSDGSRELVRIGLGWTDASPFASQSSALTAASKDSSDAKKTDSKSSDSKSTSVDSKPVKVQAKKKFAAKKPLDIKIFGCPLSANHPDCDKRKCKVKVKIGPITVSKKGKCDENVYGFCACILWTIDLPWSKAPTVQAVQTEDKQALDK